MTLNEKIIELVPEIVSLKFGCKVEVHVDSEGFANEGSIEHTPCANTTGYVTHSEYLECNDDYAGDILVKNIINGYLGEDYDGISCEIIGRPITLADVLRAIRKISQHGSWSVTQDGRLYDIGHDDCGPMWNLSTDLDGQTKETKDFLAKILGV